MNKCDFCKCYDPIRRHCVSYVGSGSCEEAARRYVNFVRSKNSRTHTKNININKRRNTGKRR